MRTTKFAVWLLAGLLVMAACDDDGGPVPVASVAVSPDSSAIPVEGTQQLTATTSDAAGNVLTGRTVTWTSSNTALATVDGNGLVTAVAAGSVTITATSEGQNGTAPVTVLETFTATLLGGNEVPAVTSNAVGTATVIIDGSVLSYTVQLTNIDDVVASHIHSAAVGTNGGVIVPLFGGPTTGIGFTGTLVDDTMTVDAATLADIRAGNTYVNVHTAVNPGGELRGQLFTLADEDFEAMLNGASEVPPVTTTASGGATHNVRRMLLTYAIDVAGIDNVTAAHIHSGARGVNGGVIVPLFAGPTTGTGFTGTLVADTITITDSVLLELRSEDTYTNVHTTANPGGEIRGQNGVSVVGPVSPAR